MRDHDNAAASAARELRNAARDALRVGSQWARAAYHWVEEMGNDAGHRHDFDDAHGGHRGYEGHGRDDRDIQGEHSAQQSNIQGGAHGEGNPYSQRMHGKPPSRPGAPRGSVGYRGLGPKNYTRWDERIREDLSERLTEADDIDASDVSVEVSHGIATLDGTVAKRWMKHRAEDLAEGCADVRDVHNRIRVASPSAATGDAASPGRGSSASTDSPLPGARSASGRAGADFGVRGSPPGTGASMDRPGSPGSADNPSAH